MKYKIALFKADGVGPELINETKKVLEKASELDKFEIEWIDYPDCAEHFFETKEQLNEKILSEIKKTCNAIFCGTFGDPRIKTNEYNPPSIIKDFFDQFVSVKPIKLFPNVDSYINGKTHNEVDFTIIKENFEDMYCGLCSKARAGKSRQKLELRNNPSNAKFSVNIEANSELEYQIGVLSTKKCEQFARFALDYAKKKGIGAITSIDKANMLDFHNLWRRSFSGIVNEYNEVKIEFELVDAAVMNFIRQPEKYKITVAPNMIGDILFDLGNMIQGGLSFSALANINPKGICMFQPSHGSANALRDKSIVNPIATIIAASLMLEQMGESKSSSLIMRSIESVMQDNRIKTQDLGGQNSTGEMAEAIADKLVELHD